MAEALSLAIQSGDLLIEARVRGNLGSLAADRGDQVAGIRETTAAMNLMTGAGSEQWQVVGATNLLGNANTVCDWAAWDHAYSILESAGQCVEARAAYLAALKLDPSAEWAKSNLARLSCGGSTRRHLSDLTYPTDLTIPINPSKVQ